MNIKASVPNMRKFKKILITGSSGTIGTALFEALLERGYQVIGFDKRANQWSKKLNKLTIKGSLLNQKDIKKLPKDFDLIIHLAANARVYNLIINPRLALENIVSTYNILEFALKSHIKNFIFSSSREVYGNQKKNIFKEEDFNLYFSESPYSATKISSEALIYAFAKCYKMNYLVFRFSNVYGKYDISDRFVPLLIRKMKRNKDIEIYSKNKDLVFTYIDDCTDGIIKGIEKFPRVKNNTLNLASPKSYKLTKVAKLLKKFLKSKSRIIVKPGRIGEVEKFRADISKAKKLLKYQPKHSLENGLKLTINWYSKFVKN